jgi:hypothetical protein
MGGLMYLLRRAVVGYSVDTGAPSEDTKRDA